MQKSQLEPVVSFPEPGMAVTAALCPPLSIKKKINKNLSLKAFRLLKACAHGVLMHCIQGDAWLTTLTALPGRPAFTPPARLLVLCLHNLSGSRLNKEMV